MHGRLHWYFAFLRIFKHLISTLFCLHIGTLYNRNTISKIWVHLNHRCCSCSLIYWGANGSGGAPKKAWEYNAKSDLDYDWLGLTTDTAFEPYNRRQRTTLSGSSQCSAAHPPPDSDTPCLQQNLHIPSGGVLQCLDRYNLDMWGCQPDCLVTSHQAPPQCDPDALASGLPPPWLTLRATFASHPTLLANVLGGRIRSVHTVVLPANDNHNQYRMAEWWIWRASLSSISLRCECTNAGWARSPQLRSRRIDAHFAHMINVTGSANVSKPVGNARPASSNTNAKSAMSWIGWVEGELSSTRYAE